MGGRLHGFGTDVRAYDPGDMGYKIKSYQETPNPNAIKCVLDRRTGEKTRSYFKAADVGEDALAARLFAISGVTNLLIHPEWITVSKSAGVSWKVIKGELERVLNEGE